LIVDDEKLARQLVREFLQPFASLAVVGEAGTGRQAMALIDELRPDLVFLDIQMPDCHGFEVLKGIDHAPAVIFTTAYDQYAIKAFEAHAVDYLLKPLDEDRFCLAVERALERLEASPALSPDTLLDSMRQALPAHYASHFIVQKSGRMLNIPTDSIMYLEASGDYAIIHTETGEYISAKTLTSLAERLDPKRFLRIHRSTIIHIAYLREVERHFNKGLLATMQNGKQFPVSRTYTAAIRDLLL
jgi:two-component system LytT family response regulator